MTWDAKERQFRTLHPEGPNVATFQKMYDRYALGRYRGRVGGWVGGSEDVRAWVGGWVGGSEDVRAWVGGWVGGCVDGNKGNHNTHPPHTHTTYSLHATYPDAQISAFFPGFLRQAMEEWPWPRHLPKVDEVKQIDELRDGFLFIVRTCINQRVDQTEPLARETLFVDGTHGVTGDGQTEQIWFMTNSAVGGLSLGYLVTNMKSIGGRAACFQEFQKMLPEHTAFFGRGRDRGKYRINPPTH